VPGHGDFGKREGQSRMAKETITRLIDDLDKGEADETVRFGLDGVDYEIDLSAKNAAKLRQALEPFVAAGSKVSGRTAARGQTRRRVSQPIDRAQNKAIREWAKSKKKKISDRGRIPEDIVAEYHASAGR
jgi:hypothetical protein